MFWLDNGTEKRFISRSRTFSGQEMCVLPTARTYRETVT
jgi:uncharacterized protein